MIERARSSERPIHYLYPYRAEHRIRLASLLLRTVQSGAAKASYGPSQDLVDAVSGQRLIKTEAEILEIEKAVEITAEMHLLAMRMARPGMVEREIAAAVEAVAQRHGGRLSFPSIVTIHGETLHNHYRDNQLESGQLLLCDCGAEAPSHYAGDMTRTFPVDPTFTARQREVYEVSLNAHEEAVAKLGPGVRYLDVHLTASRAIVVGLTELGLMKGDPDEAVAAGAHTLFFQCGTGHLMGLDVHDMENLGEDRVGYGPELDRDPRFGFKFLRLARELEPGFVLTVEPGIYFIPELIDLWSAENKLADFIDYEKVETYRDFGGIRTEEDFVITDDGARLLGSPVAKTVNEIEAVRRESL